MIGSRSAFQAVKRPTTGDLDDAQLLMPIDSRLLPAAFCSGFNLPCFGLDHARAQECSASIEPPFRTPYPFLGSANSATCHPVARHGTEASNAVKAGPAVEDRDSKAKDTEGALVSTDEPDIGQDEGDKAKPLHKPRVVWTDELHERFLAAIEKAGSIEAAVPTVILKLMNASGLSRDNVASHLQKHRLGLKRGRSKRRPEQQVEAKRARTGAAVRQQRAGQPGPSSVQDDVPEKAPSTTQQPADAPSTQPMNDQKGSNGEEDSNERPARYGDNYRDNSDGLASDDAGAGSDNRKSCNADSAGPHDGCPPSVHPVCEAAAADKYGTGAACVAGAGAAGASDGAVAHGLPVQHSASGSRHNSGDKDGGKSRSVHNSNGVSGIRSGGTCGSANVRKSQGVAGASPDPAAAPVAKVAQEQAAAKTQ